MKLSNKINKQNLLTTQIDGFAINNWRIIRIFKIDKFTNR